MTVYKAQKDFIKGIIEESLNPIDPNEEPNVIADPESHTLKLNDSVTSEQKRNMIKEIKKTLDPKQVYYNKKEYEGLRNLILKPEEHGFEKLGSFNEEAEIVTTCGSLRQVILNELNGLFETSEEKLPFGNDINVYKNNEKTAKIPPEMKDKNGEIGGRNMRNASRLSPLCMATATNACSAAVTGVVLGSAIGAATGAMTSSTSSSIAIGAAIGAAIGVISGGACGVLITDGIENPTSRFFSDRIATSREGQQNDTRR